MTPTEIIQAVRALASGKDPDLNITDILLKHKCPFLASKLKSTINGQSINPNQALNNIAIKERYKACKPIFDTLEIPYAVIKGAVLSNSAYNDPYMRFSSDIDFLINRSDADHFKKLLTSLGFVQGRIVNNSIVPFSRREILFQASFSHQTAPFIKQTGNILCPFVKIDVNMDVMWGESEKKADMDFVLSHVEKISLLDNAFYKLTSEMELISLCLHHYKDMNSLYLLSDGRLKLGLFCDIYLYLINCHPDPQKLLDICKQLDVGRYIYVCIYHTLLIFDDPTLKEYLNILDSEKDTSLFDAFGLNDDERKSWNLSLFERLFHPDLPRYVDSLLSDEEKEKIRLNQINM